VRRIIVFASLAAAAACGGDSPNPVKEALARTPETALRGDAVAFRFPGRSGATARLYRLPDLEEVSWRFEAGASDVAGVVTFDTDEDLVYTVTARGVLIALDLASGRARAVDSNVVRTAVGPTGIVYLVHADGSVSSVQRRTVQRWSTRFDSIPSAIWGAVRNRLLGLVEREGERVLQVLTDGQQPSTNGLPGGRVTAAPWGDAVAVATDSGVVVLEPGSALPARFVEYAGVVDVAFSPSGHRLYAATRIGELRAFERFELPELGRLRLPGSVRELRVDPLGRLLLARADSGDAVWTIDLQTWDRVAALRSAWSADLPAVAPDGSVLLRQRNQVVVVDPRTFAEVGEATDGGADRWLALAWDPRRPALEFTRQAASPPAAPGQLIYVQVGSTHNPAWADEFARNLRAAGVSASVLAPRGTDELYRIVLGP
jgi:hypothetical protein